MMDDNIRHLRRLVLARGVARSDEQITRAGSILLSRRPVIKLDGTEIPTAENVPQDFDAAQWAAARSHVSRIAPSVGRVRVDFGSGPKTCGTCFRIPGGTARIITAGHMLEAIFGPSSRVRKDYEFADVGARRHFDVEFDGRSFRIERLLWAHAKWDLLVAECALEAQDIPAVPAEMFETTRLGINDLGPIGVVGFPISRGNDDPTTQSEFASIFAGKIDEKCFSPGFGRGCDSGTDPIPSDTTAENWYLWHDATTIQGNSGSPVFSLLTGKIIGVHVLPGRRSNGISTPNVFNRAVDLPVGFSEQELAAVVLGTGNVTGQGQLWNPSIRQWVSRTARRGGEGIPSPDGPAFGAIRKDRADMRDLRYRPALVGAPDEILKGPIMPVRSQGNEASCVGCALATVVDAQLLQRGQGRGAVSARMLYEAAREHDEFLDFGVGGTSLRGAIKGFYNMGVCSEATAPYLAGQDDWSLSLDAAVEAGNITLGAFYRIDKRPVDTQLAVVEGGAALVSARIHSGWLKPVRGRIRQQAKAIGTHAFVIVGYDKNGFIVQNSWGKGWSNWKGHDGLAHWTYQDWSENVLDAWVLRISPHAPNTLGLEASRVDLDTSEGAAGQARSSKIRRSLILGHVAETEAGGILSTGKLGPGISSLRETAMYLARSSGKRTGPKKYRDILLILHDPFVDPDEPAQTARAMIDIFKNAGIYPFHIFHGLDAARSFSAWMEAERASAEERYRLGERDLETWLSGRASAIGGGIAGLLVNSARDAALPGGAIHDVISVLTSEFRPEEHPRRLHLAGFGLGAVSALEFAAMPTDRLPAGCPQPTSVITVDGLILCNCHAPAAHLAAGLFAKPAQSHMAMGNLMVHALPGAIERAKDVKALRQAPEGKTSLQIINQEIVAMIRKSIKLQPQ